HVSGGGLPLTLGDDPVLDADPLARVRIRPSGHIAGSEHSRCARLQKLVDDDAAIDGKAGPFGDRERWPNTRADDNEVGIDGAAAAQSDRPIGKRCDGLAEMEDHSVRLVKTLNELPDLCAHDLLERPLLGATTSTAPPRL